MSTITVSELRDAMYHYLPNVMHIASIPKNELDKKIEKYIKQIVILPSDTVITRLHSMFAMVNCAAKGSVYYQDLLSFYDEQANNLHKNICQGNITWQNKVKAKLKQSILDISDDNVANPTNPAFMNYMGEIFYATTIIPRAQEGRYEFLGFDVLMNNGKDADLHFRRMDDGMMIYFDNLSIHGVDVSKVNQSEDLYFFLEKKIVDKCNSKTVGLQKEENGYHINGKVSEFHVAPFLWNETSDMLPYKDAFQHFQNEENVSGLFVALKPQRLPTGKYHFSIETVANILLQWQKQECIIIKMIHKVRAFLDYIFCIHKIKVPI